jgi:16S rRNA (adenine1518-N6/adenine1519-N6)-dimethyltransferase
LIRPKKFLGQHFLTDELIASTIVDALSLCSYDDVIEIGPGMGVLTNYLKNRVKGKLTLIELDRESIVYLHEHFKESNIEIIEGDFLSIPLDALAKKPLGIIGNFPYNISTQILFKVYENKSHVLEVVGMFQKEVAERICSQPGKKAYGIMSVLLQSCYDCSYLFTVNETVFNPPPKVKSGVIKLTLNPSKKLKCDELLFKKIVKTAFNQRRKTLRNALKSIVPSQAIMVSLPYLDKRAEQLSWQQFEELTLLIFP